MKDWKTFTEWQRDKYSYLDCDVRRLMQRSYQAGQRNCKCGEKFKQLQIKHIDEKIEIYKQIIYMEESYKMWSLSSIDDKIKDLQNQKSILEKE